MQVYSDSHRWHLNCGLWQKQHYLLKGLRKVKKVVPPMGKPEEPPAGLDHPAREGRQYARPTEMIGHYLGELSIINKSMKQCQPGIGATHSSHFILLS
ncbi:hypothetical protein U0070_012155 [Myodes glareolus]|uniref:40S ribosomal protein S15 n=1 Tax=Myodes glareolus TaxID=447135 RepID=A0AAW0K120_MYOGA